MKKFWWSVLGLGVAIIIGIMIVGCGDFHLHIGEKHLYPDQQRTEVRTDNDEGISVEIEP